MTTHFSSHISEKANIHYESNYKTRQLLTKILMNSATILQSVQS